jgi:hypothetical protein
LAFNVRGVQQHRPHDWRRQTLPTNHGTSVMQHAVFISMVRTSPTVVNLVIIHSLTMLVWWNHDDRALHIMR